MRIQGIDHFVITTTDLKACLGFYVGLLGMEHREKGGHHNLYFPGGKISIHVRKHEFYPSATNPETGAQDFCLIVEDSPERLLSEIRERGYKIVEGDVLRNGSRGILHSTYLYDPDGNLVELGCYGRIADGNDSCSQQDVNVDPDKK